VRQDGAHVRDRAVNLVDASGAVPRMPGMTQKHSWETIEPILDAALELPPEQRRELLERECATDPVLRKEVEDILIAAEEDGGFLDTSAASFGALLVGADLSDESSDMPQDRQIGPYRLIRGLGRGGMGTVYLAERADGQFEQQVALKLIKRGMDTDEIHRRFLSERQILARLNHPHIARLLDGGVTMSGQPWFAMEYVDGAPLTTYCKERKLGNADRLRLFEDVCEAVRYAHQNLIVHRDLKPSNILVTADGAVKLLDFGIAKLLDEAPGEHSQLGTGLRAMTPEYAAPEQVRLEPVTTATDVYALGAVLYELLTGRRVHAFVRLTQAEIERVVCEVDVQPPHIGPDLDTIVMKALQKDPYRRYPTAEALLEDLHRYEAGLPVRARPDTPGYRARKFLRRHRVAVAAVSGIVLSLIGGLAVAAWQAGVARREATRALAVKDFLVGVFESSDPERSGGVEITARELLARGTRRVDSALANAPEIRAEIFDVVGRSYYGLGHFSQADSVYRRAVELSRAIYGPSHPIVADRLTHWSVALLRVSQYDRADSLLFNALSIRERALGRDHADVGETLTELANLKRLKGDYATGEKYFRRALAIDGLVSRVSPVRLASDWRLFGLLLWEAGKYAAADTALREALSIVRRHLDADHPETIRVLRNIALLRYSQGELVEAEQVGRDVLKRRRRLYPRGHPDVATALHELGGTLEQAGAWPEAESLLLEALEMRRTWLGPNRVETFDTMLKLAAVRQRMGDLASAEAAARTVATEWRRMLGENHPLTLTALNSLGSVLRERGQLDEAERTTRQALNGRRQRLGAGHAAVGVSLRELAVVLHRMSRHPEAERALREALDVYRTSVPARHLNVAAALTDLGAVLNDEGRPQEAEPLLREALAIRTEKLQPADPRLAETRRVLGVCVARLGRYEESESLLLESFGALKENPYGARQREETRRALNAFYERQGKGKAAAGYRDSRRARVPNTLAEAIEQFDGSDFAKRAFGDDVVEDCLHFYRSEQRLGRSADATLCHSSRNVIAGSTAAARRAGAQHARAATPPSNAITPA
jgi:tetratricopeptide (TPR) repeat protein/predicted Ser/Thr protein kinase